MFKKISDTMTFPLWAKDGTRFRKLDIYDRLLDGKFYDHLGHSFYDEEDGSGRYIKLLDRRPSCQYRLPRYIARWAARKLFAGRHIPKVRAPTKEIENKIKELLTGTKIWPTLYEAAYRGSIGSVAISFRVEDGKIGLKVWRAAWCSPQFDDFGELVQLRVHYATSGYALRAIGLSVPEEPQNNYWFIRDYRINSEITYKPVPAADWNPVEGFRDPSMALEPEPSMTVEHSLGFVPGIWITNPGGTQVPDGCALWEDAIPNTIEVDYLLSQAARGARYNCAPLLMTVGEVLNKPDGKDGVNPTTVLAFPAQHKDGPTGEMVGGGHADLLEMSGSGAEAALKIVDTLKKLALEQIGVVQKDPGEMPGPLSGRAMEYLDEDAHDTAMQWRTTYGEGGALSLICKILRTLDKSIDITKLWLQWPRIYQPTPADLQSIVQALVQATSPGQVKGQTPGEDGSVAILPPLLDLETAQKWLAANMDLGILDDTEGDSPTGPSGGDPIHDEGSENGVSQVGPFWRILPPTKVNA